MSKRARSPVDAEAGRPSPCKRRRVARSLSSPPTVPVSPPTTASPPAPLTHQNLSLHDSLCASASASPMAPRSRTGSPSKTDTSGRMGDTEDKLRFYGIHFNTGRALPDELKLFIDQALRAPRDAVLRSPNAARVARAQNSAHRMAEQDGIDEIKDELLYDKYAHEHLSRKAKPNLNKAYLPPCIEPTLLRDYGPLETPQPDHLFGYRHSRECSEVPPFAETDEFALFSSAVVSGQHFPFLSAQWKSPRNGQTHFQARLQGARDGAAIVNYHHKFLADAGVTDPSVVDTAHFSVTCDLETVILYVHWREAEGDRVKYYMEDIENAFLKRETQVSVVRSMLRNLLDHVMGARKDKFRCATIDLVEKRRKQGVLSSAASISSAGGAIWDPSLHLPPPTPPSLVSDGPAGHAAKRQRTGSAPGG